MSKEDEAAAKAAADEKAKAEAKAAEEAKAAAEAEAKELAEFDPERAMRTIKAQRESEAAALAKAKGLEDELAKYRKVDDDKAEAEKALEVKVAERDAALAGKDAEIAELHVRTSFTQEALALGIEDPELAYLAAKAQGALGKYDPKAGEVGDHDWDTLGEKYPSFKAQEGHGKTGDAGARGKGTVLTDGQQFNKAIRTAFGRG